MQRAGVAHIWERWPSGAGKGSAAGWRSESTGRKVCDQLRASCVPSVELLPFPSSVLVILFLEF